MFLVSSLAEELYQIRWRSLGLFSLVVAHSGHNGSFLGNAICSLQIFLVCHRDSHGL